MEEFIIIEITESMRANGVMQYLIGDTGGDMTTNPKEAQVYNRKDAEHIIAVKNSSSIMFPKNELELEYLPNTSLFIK